MFIEPAPYVWPNSNCLQMADERNELEISQPGDEEEPSLDDEPIKLEDFVTAQYRKQKVHVCGL